MKTIVNIILINLLNVYDVIVTFIGVHILGKPETNPLIKELVENDYFAAACLKLLVVFLICLNYYMAKDKTLWHKVMVFIILIYVIAMIANSIALFS